MWALKRLQSQILILSGILGLLKYQHKMPKLQKIQIRKQPLAYSVRGCLQPCGASGTVRVMFSRIL